MLGRREIGILSVIQPEPESENATAHLVLTTHDAAFGNMQAAVAEICELDCTKESPTLLRIETLN